MNTVEGFAYQVPRTRINYFQDDLYPDTLCVEEPALLAQEWFQGKNVAQKSLSMKPQHMKPCKVYSPPIIVVILIILQ